MKFPVKIVCFCYERNSFYSKLLWWWCVVIDVKNITDFAPSVILKTHNDSVLDIVHNTSHNYGSSFTDVVLSSFLEYLCP